VKSHLKVSKSMQQYILSTKFLWIHAEKQGFAFHYILLGTFASDFTPISFFCDTFGNWKLLGFYYFNTLPTAMKRTVPVSSIRQSDLRPLIRLTKTQTGNF